MELTTGIEPVTSPLPRECSTTEPRELKYRKSGAGDAIRTRDIQLGRLALYQLSYTRLFRWWREMDSNHRRETPSDLQSDAFGRSAIPPIVNTLNGAGYRT